MHTDDSIPIFLLPLFCTIFTAETTLPRDFKILILEIKNPKIFKEIIIIMVIFKCYFSREHIALSYKKWCEHRIGKTPTD